jgi:hypothetical protein
MLRYRETGRLTQRPDGTVRGENVPMMGEVSPIVARPQFAFGSSIQRMLWYEPGETRTLLLASRPG